MRELSGRCPCSRALVKLSSAVGGRRAADNVEKRRLAGTIRADQRMERPGVTSQVAIGERDVSAEPPGEAGNLEQRGHGEDAGPKQAVGPPNREGTSSAPKKVMRQSATTRRNSGNSVTKAAPSSGARDGSPPPSTT